MPKPLLFISCASANLDIARRAAAFLEDRGFKIWLYDSELRVGTRDWLKQVHSVIRESAGVVLIATPQLTKSPEAHQEATLAYAENINLYPVHAAGERLEECVWESFLYFPADIRGESFERGMAKLASDIHENLRDSAGDAVVVDNRIAEQLAHNDGNLFSRIGKKRPGVSGLVNDADHRLSVCAYLKNRIVREYELIYVEHPRRREELRAFALAFLYQSPAHEIATELGVPVESVEVLKLNALTFLQTQVTLVMLVRDWLEVAC